MIKEVIVVEGRDDTVAIKRAVKADTIETGGSAISKEVIRQIQKAQETRGVIVFTDPDYPGEKIRKTISQHVSGIKHAFITKEEAIKNGDLGVENASPEVIKRALSQVKTEWIEEPIEMISWERLIDAGLVGGQKARQRRLALGNALGIGYANAKQLYSRLKMFRISEEEFINALKSIDEKE
ncbi:ribonuclease M5 [Vulcanibacillus modesticaldus]|uniref:Ribonuclease M5 n=1 Tax=Vulcanibacillus modesticaldus TaxID=337097 RepID=A0A1D2YXM3_9BACI|nr:ribonuclease M5 [Vulcanibacillus modesticaldus]